MAQQFDIVGNLLLKVDGAEAGVNKLRNSLSKLKLPNNIDSDLKKSFSNLDGLFSKYKSQLQNGFKTKTDVSGFTKTAKEINAEYDKITKKISQLNNTNVTFNIKNDSIVAAEKNLNKLLETQKKLTQDTKSSIEKELAAVTKAGSRSTNVKDISSQLSTAINTGDMQKAVELAQQLKTKMVELKSAQTSWAKSGSTISLSDTLDKIVAACQKGAQGFDGLEKETKEAAQVLANLQAGDLEKINQLLDGMSGDWDKSTSAMKAASGEMEAYASAAQSAVQQVKDLQQSTQYFFSLRNMMNLLKRGIREAVDVVKELDAAMTATAVVTDFSVGDMWQKLPEYTANANALGASVKDMYEATTLYYQQGLRTEAAMGIANETMKMARIGGLDAADATDKMTAALRGFNMEINEASAQRVNDVYSNLAAKTASDTEELGTAMQRTASIAASAGMSFEGTAAFLAQAIETTREPAENLGTAMKTIVARFTELKKNPLEITEVDGEEVSYNKVDTALQSIGVSLKDANGQFRDLDKVFLDISKRWDSLTQTQQRYVATTAAGSRQQSRFIAMMSNYERTMQLMDYANNSAGASNEQFGKTMESLEAKLNKLKNAWNQFLMGIMNDSWTKKIVDGTTTAIDQINNLINLLSGGGKLKGVKSFLSLFTAFMGLKFAGGLANFGIGKLGKLVDPTAKKGALNLDGTKGIASKITTPIVAKLNELIAVTKGQKTSDKTISSTLAGYKNATNLLRMPQTMGTTRSTFGQLSDEHAYAAYINSPGTTSAMKRTAMQWLNAKQLGPEMQKTGEQLMDSIFKGMERKQIPPKKGTKLIGKPELWGEYLGTETAKSFSNNFIKIQKTREAQQAKQIADARKQAWAQAGGDPYASDAVKELQYKTNANGIKDRYLQAYKQIRQQQKEAFGGSLNTKAVNPKPYEQLANQVGTLGSNFTAAGYSMQMFGAQLGQLSPGLAGVGNLISRLGVFASTAGMTIAGFGSTYIKIAERIVTANKAMARAQAANVLVDQMRQAGMKVQEGFAGSGQSAGGAWIKGFLGNIPKPLIAAGLIAILGGTIAAISKHIEKQAQEAGKKVRESFEENFTKADEKINSLEEYKDRFEELSKGVDQFGHNINLSAEEYDEYLNISKELQQLSPSLIAGYNAEGEAIIKKGNAVQEVIDKLKKAKQEELDLFTKDSSINKLIGEYKTSDVYKNNHTDAASPINRGYSNFAQERIDIAKLKDSDKLINSINQLTGWNLNSLNNLTTSQLSWLSKHYSDVIGLVEEQNGKLSDEVKDGYIDAFANAGSAINEVMTEGQPIIDAMQQWMGLEGIDAVGLGLGEEFGNSFNEGLQGIMLTGLSEGWSADTFKSNIRDYANEWDELAGSTSKYADIMEDAKDVQDEYLNSMGSDNAIQDYNTSIAESCNKLIELANNTDTATAAGQAFQQQCIAQANALRNYATEGGMALSQALNTATDDIQQAEAALDNFNEATKTDLYTAAEGMKSIYDKAFETYKDSFGGEYEKHFESKGDRTAWEAGRTILGEDVLKSIPDGQALKNKLKEWEPALREGEEGWYNFWKKVTGDESIQKNLKKLEDAGVELDENGFLSHVPEDQWSNVAKALGISEAMLTSMLNKGRQFADIDFTNWAETRHALETSNVGIEGTVKTANGNGQRKLFIKEETFEAALADANYKPEEYESKKAEAREKQNLEFLKAASEYNGQELQKVFRDEMGISNLTDLISTLSATGDYTKDEIEAYAEKAGFKGDFDSIYDKVAEAVENPELYKQTSVLEKISGQIALLSQDNVSTDSASTDRKEFAQALYGTLGKIDSEADYFAHGQDKEGQKLTIEQYEATKKSLEAQKALAEQQASMAQARATNASTPEEQAKWLEIANQYSQDANNISTYISKGIAAFEASEQEKSTLTQQATEQARALVESNASNAQIKTSMQEAAKQMAEAKMKPDDIAAALNKSYGTNLQSKDVNIGQDGKVELNLDQDKLREQLSNLHADVEANIIGISVGGHATMASGQNNPNSVFHRHGTMARGSRYGYTISGRPTLTGEEGEELVWEPKRNEAYMVGSNGPQFANISKDAVVWNAAQTKRIKKNSKVGSFGTGARGISKFGTMAGGTGGLRIPGVLDVDAKAIIQDVVPPDKEPSIPVKADLQVEGTGGGFLGKLFGGKKGGPSVDVAANITSVNTASLQAIPVTGNVTKLNNQATADNIKATATVTKVEKSGQIAGEPITVKATATATQVKNNAPTPKVSAGAQTINVTANTGAAQAKVNQLINLFKKTYTLKYKASGPSSISVPISANFVGSWKKTVTISKSGGSGSGAKGINNYIAHYTMPAFNSAAGGYGQLGPKGRGGLTLTGEKGFEIAWLPSENRSMILGTTGPQMLNLPPDAVVYTHEQSKKILKQKSIPAGSHSAESSIKYNPSKSRYSSNKSSSSTAKTKSKATKKTTSKKKTSKKTATEKGPKTNQWSFEEVIRFDIDQNLLKLTSKLNQLTKTIEKDLKKIGNTAGDIGNKVKEQTDNLKAQLDYHQKELESYQRQQTDMGNFNAKISYNTGGKKDKEATIKFSDYMTQNADGIWVINEAAVQAAGNIAKQEAIYNAINGKIKEINDGIWKEQDTIYDLQNQIEDNAKKVAEAFYLWENELTEIYDLSQQIAAQTAMQDRFSSQVALELARLNTGFGDTAQSIAIITKANERNNQTLLQQIQTQKTMIEARERELDAFATGADELEKLTILRNKEVGTGAGQFATQEIKNQAVAEAEQRFKAVEAARNYFVGGAPTKNEDGSLTYSIDWAKFNQDILNGQLNEETAKSIKDYFEKLNTANVDFNNAIKENTDTIKATYDKLKEYQDYIVGFEDTLLQQLDEQSKKAIDSAEKLGDTITNSLKNLLDEVKRKLDERRKQEDNTKTEKDISQKQQRLSALRADTSGGHQVEIAQLEKEIAEARQSYGRTLEDQLLDRLQQQGDEATKQRERQIELAQAQLDISSSNNKKLVEIWLNDPTKYKEEIKAAWLEAQDYDSKGLLAQQQLNDTFNSSFAELIQATTETAATQGDNINTTIDTINNLGETLQSNNAQSNALQDVTLRNTQTGINNQGSVSTAAVTNLKKLGAKDTEVLAAGADKETVKQVYGSNNSTPVSIPKTTVASQQSSQPTVDPKQTYMDKLKEVKTFKAKDVKSSDVNSLFDLGAKAGYGKATVLQHLVGNMGMDVFSWKSIFKAIIDAKGIDRYNLVKTWPNGDGTLAAALKTLKKPNTLAAIKKHKNYKKATALAFKSGGLADYTGPAWLDGTPSKPELVLNAKDTQNFLALRDVLDKAISSTNSVTNSYGGNATYEININVDKLTNDYDVDRVAERVKKIIVKDSGYRNVTQVRNFR